MGIFDGLTDAPMPGGGNWFRPGVYLIEVVLAKAGESQQGKGAFVAIEGDVLDVLVAFPARTSDIDGSPIEPSNNVGERCSNVIMMRNAPAFSNIKGFLVAAAGVDPASVTPAMAEKAFGGDGKGLAGVRLIARATQIKTKAGRPFTKITYEAVRAEAPPAE